MGLKAAGIMFVLLLLAGGGFVWYYNDTQERLAILQDNNAKLQVAVQTNEEALEQQKLAFETMQAENRKLNIEFAAINERNKALENRLSRHDIGASAVAKTKLTEKILNNATKNAQRCLEIISGASLTDSEKAATKPSEINPECWRDANPNFNPDIQSDAWKRKNL